MYNSSIILFNYSFTRILWLLSYWKVLRMINSIIEHYGNILFPIGESFMYIHENIDLISRSLERADAVFNANYVTCTTYQELGFI